jgi:hypothetical protein
MRFRFLTLMLPTLLVLGCGAMQPDQASAGAPTAQAGAAEAATPATPSPDADADAALWMRQADAACQSGSFSEFWAAFVSSSTVRNTY